MVTVMMEQLVLVDEDDEVVGHETKEKCHHGMGKVHRAFSILILTTDGRMLLQKRSPLKSLWPQVWSNSVCSHPRKGEKVEEAARRRLREELGIDIPIHYLYKFKYHASYLEVGSESEMCYVFFGVYDGPITPDSNEIEAIQFVPMDRVKEAMDQSPEFFTPWFKMEWECILNRYMERIMALIDSKQ
jgi:isopentenyl-diphosphate delta-isomerase